MSPRGWKLEVFQIEAWTNGCGHTTRASATQSRGESSLVSAVHIKHGSYRRVPLDNLNLAAIAEWPGPVLEGRGRASYYVDIRADGAQRDVLRRIVEGKSGGPFRIYGKMVEEAFQPKRAVISMIINGPRSGLKIESLAEVQLEPVPSRPTRVDGASKGSPSFSAVRGEASAKTLRVNNGLFKFDCPGGYASYKEAVWSGTRTTRKDESISRTHFLKNAGGTGRL